ncbi:hypothetical protein [Streptomyces sp. Ru72]|uniref:hypothetical protein n=1 Tax=Streptomyces sp. Ru72 TaxID=2080747 RepID=UPI000CDD4F12|nr:hypothetical protein [Streptomyces sp. Ru72]POX44667.1 hypothetical protein C3488_32165 [Streptomyces sp. Ru72]
MEGTIYQVPWRQRRSFLFWIIGLSFLPGAAIIANWHRDGWWGAGPFGPITLLIDLIYINLASGRTVVDARGIRTSRLLGRRSWSWDEIESIAVEVEENKKSGNVTHLAVQSTDGRRRYLFAPWSHDMIHGADFNRTANAILKASAMHHAGIAASTGGTSAEAAAAIRLAPAHHANACQIRRDRTTRGTALRSQVSDGRSAARHDGSWGGWWVEVGGSRLASSLHCGPR